LLSLFIFRAFLNPVQAQSGIGHSPVSRLYTGYPLEFGISRNEATGGCGQAVPDEDHPNFQNPSLLHFNKKVNLNTDLRYIYRNLRQNTESDYRIGAAGPALLSITFPVSNRISAGFGIRPYSFRDFIYQNVRYASGDSIGMRIRGSGGLSQVFMSTGFRIGKYLSIGLEGSYVFGTLQDSVTFGVLPSTSNYVFSNIVKRKAAQFLLRPGLHFMQPLSKENGVFLSAGFTADLGNRIALRRYNQFSIPGTNFRDTLEFEVPSSLSRPENYSVGIGLFSPMAWSVSTEMTYTQAKSMPADGSITFSDCFSWAAGAEYRPGTKKSTAYLNLITYRAGFAFRTHPFSDNSGPYQDMRFTTGASFPITRKDAKFTRPIINLSIAAGSRGREQSIFGKERYLQIQLGFTLNDFLWFNRYKID
jgi:hypothetical protein